MTKILIVAMMIFMTLSMGGSWNAAAQTIDLSQYLWKNRLLLIFAPNRTHPTFDALLDSLADHEPGVSDRDLVIFEILESAPSLINQKSIDLKAAQLLRERFNVDRGEFRVILIGKDGGVKLNREDQTDLPDIFTLIDSMPMRQEEIRQKSQ